MMSHRPERRKLPLIAVHAETATTAQRRVAELLDAAGSSPAEVHTLIAAIQAGAVEGAQGEVIELDTQAPSGSSDQVHEAWLRAVEAITGRLAHVAAAPSARPERRPPASRHRRPRRATPGPPGPPNNLRNRV
jgi:hypothetical protein